jgi:dUTP pyrophosphatase
MKQLINVKIKTLREDVVVPRYQSEGAAGFDLVSSISQVIQPYTWETIPCGFALELPEGYELQIRSRSGMAGKGLIVLNQPGTVDSDYRGEIKVMLMNVGFKAQHVVQGSRIAQGVLSPVLAIKFMQVKELTESVRGDNGFGSTGE